MRIACGIEYDGQPFYGFQVQLQEPTVQSCLEKAISQVANHPVRISCAGRTDTGVSATQQVIHFETDAVRKPHQWILGINTAVHAGIAVLWVKEVSDDFHARFSATSRSYQYQIINRRVKPAINRHHLTWVIPSLNHQTMHEAAQCLLGTHDFSSFRSSRCQANHPTRTMTHAKVTRQGEIISCQFKANGFLHHMIRNLIGTLIKIGTGEKPIGWMKEVLELKDRTQAGMTAAPNGLTFTGVNYPKTFDLPRLKMSDE